MRRRLALGTVIVIGALSAGAALAHDLKDPRVVIVVAAKKSVELRVNDMSSVAESDEIRRRFDGDRDGRLDDSEQSDLTSFLAIRATVNLSLEENGKKLPLVTASRVLRNGGGRIDAHQPLSVDVVLHAAPAATAAAGGAVTLVVGDWRADEHPVRMAVLGSSVTIVSASAGDLDEKRGLVTGVSLDRKRVLTLRYRP